jgi:hypothetical protein
MRHTPLKALESDRAFLNTPAGPGEWPSRLRNQIALLREGGLLASSKGNMQKATVLAQAKNLVLARPCLKINTSVRLCSLAHSPMTQMIHGYHRAADYKCTRLRRSQNPRGHIWSHNERFLARFGEREEWQRQRSLDQARSRKLYKIMSTPYPP